MAGRDDVTGEPLSKRPDDTEEVFKVRLDQHHQMAMPLLDHYQAITVDVAGETSDAIYPQIEKAIVDRLGVLPGRMPDIVSISSFKQKKMIEEEEVMYVASGTQ